MCFRSTNSEPKRDFYKGDFEAQGPHRKVVIVAIIGVPPCGWHDILVSLNSALLCTPGAFCVGSCCVTQAFVVKQGRDA